MLTRNLRNLSQNDMDPTTRSILDAFRLDEEETFAVSEALRNECMQQLMAFDKMQERGQGALVNEEAEAEKQVFGSARGAEKKGLMKPPKRSVEGNTMLMSVGPKSEMDFEKNLDHVY